MTEILIFIGCLLVAIVYFGALVCLPFLMMIVQSIFTRRAEQAEERARLSRRERRYTDDVGKEAARKALLERFGQALPPPRKPFFKKPDSDTEWN